MELIDGRVKRRNNGETTAKRRNDETADVLFVADENNRTALHYRTQSTIQQSIKASNQTPLP
jgi:hypothetical protein